MQALILISSSNNNSKTKTNLSNFIKANGLGLHRWLAEGEKNQWAVECNVRPTMTLTLNYFEKMASNSNLT